MSDAAWPEGSVSLFSGALSERTLAAAVAESDAMAACAPNFWVPREAIEAVRQTQHAKRWPPTALLTRSTAQATAPRCLAEQVVYELYDRVMVRTLGAHCTAPLRVNAVGVRSLTASWLCAA